MYYIVKQGEKIQDIAKKYNCSLEELRKYNHHITDFQRVNPGMRLNIPVITKDIETQIEKEVPFVEDFYKKEMEVKKEVQETKEERPDVMTQQKVEPQVNQNTKNTEQAQDDRACYKYNYQYAGATPYPPRPVYPQPYPYPMYQQPVYVQPVYPQPVYVQPYNQQQYYQQQPQYQQPQYPQQYYQQQTFTNQ